MTVRVKRATRSSSPRNPGDAGTRTVTLRSKRLKSGRYTVEIGRETRTGTVRLATKR